MGTLVCRIELDKQKGVILTVENGSDKITQTIVMDGTNIQTTVSGSDGASTITQDQNGIMIDCKSFVLNAETIECNSSRTTDLTSGEGTTIAGQDVSVSADSGVDVSAMNVKVDGDAETKISGLKLTLSGKNAAEFKAGSIKVNSQGMMDLNGGGMLKIQGAIVNIKNLKNIS